MNKYRRRRLLLIIPLIILIIFLVLFINSSKKNKHLTYYPKKTEYLNKVDTIAYMIFDEIVYTASDDGIVEYELGEGSRVPEDQKIASLSLTGDDDELKEELMRVQATIEYKNQDSQAEDEMYQVSEEDANLITVIQNSFNKTNKQDSLEAIEALELNTSKNINISEISHMINLSNQELEDRKEKLSKKISTSNLVYEAGEAGVISYKIDGLEKEFSKENLDQIDLEFLEKNKNVKAKSTSGAVKKGDPLYKIIDNFQYHMALAIKDKKMIDDLEKGEKLEILIDDSLSIEGQIVQINKEDQGAVLILYSNEKLVKLGYDRTHQVSLIKNRIDTYMIESNSIIEVDGQTGVYVEELNGLVNFKPVHIFLQNNESTLVRTGDDNGSIDLENGEKAKTITIYDEILSDPSKVEEGQVI